MSPKVERTGGAVLAWTSRASHKHVPIEYRAGNIYIARGVHRAVADFVAEIVRQLGLGERPLVLMQHRKPTGVFERDDLYGVKIYPEAAGIPTTIQYPRSIGLRRSFTVKDETRGDTREISLVDWALVCALLQIRFPRESRRWIEDAGAEFVLHGGDDLRRRTGESVL